MHGPVRSTSTLAREQICVRQVRQGTQQVDSARDITHPLLARWLGMTQSGDIDSMKQTGVIAVSIEENEPQFREFRYCCVTVALGTYSEPPDSGVRAFLTSDRHPLPSKTRSLTGGGHLTTSRATSSRAISTRRLGKAGRHGVLSTLAFCNRFLDLTPLEWRTWDTGPASR